MPDQEGEASEVALAGLTASGHAGGDAVGDHPRRQIVEHQRAGADDGIGAGIRRARDEVVVATEDRYPRDELAARPAAVEHPHRGVEPASEDGVDHLSTLVGSADHDHAAHDALPPAEPRNGSMVAWPGALTPWPLNTCATVLPMISRSRRVERWSTYHTSNANFSSHVTALRPFTCAQPVIPGRTSWRRACWVVYSGRYSMSSGRGPTRLMSPCT